jgi:hypothetical protein
MVRSVKANPADAMPMNPTTGSGLAVFGIVEVAVCFGSSTTAGWVGVVAGALAASFGFASDVLEGDSTELHATLTNSSSRNSPVQKYFDNLFIFLTSVLEINRSRNRPALRSFKATHEKAVDAAKSDR